MSPVPSSIGPASRKSSQDQTDHPNLVRDLVPYTATTSAHSVKQDSDNTKAERSDKVRQSLQPQFTNHRHYVQDWTEVQTTDITHPSSSLGPSESDRSKSRRTPSATAPRLLQSQFNQHSPAYQSLYTLYTQEWYPKSNPDPIPPLDIVSVHDGPAFVSIVDGFGAFPSVSGHVKLGLLNRKTGALATECFGRLVILNGKGHFSQTLHMEKDGREEMSFIGDKYDFEKDGETYKFKGRWAACLPPRIPAGESCP